MLRFIKACILLLLFIPLSLGSEKQDTEHRFHESWSKEECTALARFCHYLQHDFSSDMWKRHTATLEALRSHAPEYSHAVQAETEQPGEAAFHDKIRQEIAPMAVQLAEIARTGNASEPKHRTTSALILAAQTGHLETVKALVAHGADVNAPQHNSGNELTALTPILSGCFINGRHIPWSLREPLADYLLSMGAHLNPGNNSVLIALQLSLLHGTEPWHWALDHGRQVTAADLSSLFGSPETLCLIERIIRENQLNINGDSGNTPLQALISAATCCEDTEELVELEAERKLTLLLAVGAEPDCQSIRTLNRRLKDKDLPAEMAAILTRMLNKLQYSNHHD